MSINRMLLAALLTVTLAACSQSNHGQKSAPTASQPDPTGQAAPPASPVADNAVSPANSVAASSAATTASINSAPADDAAKPCAGADANLTADRKQAYTTQVEHALEGKVKPADIKIMRFMTIDKWTAVYTSTGISDDGWFIFDNTSGKPQFKDVLGGMAMEDDRQDLIKWANGLGAPPKFAQCFAESVIQ